MTAPEPLSPPEIREEVEGMSEQFNAGSHPPPITDTSHYLIHTSDEVLGFGKNGWSIAQWHLWTDGSFAPCWMDKNDVVDVTMWRTLRKPVLDTGAQPPSPPIRYQLRNWHHVTCAGFGGAACTCLEQREKTIAALALTEPGCPCICVYCTSGKHAECWKTCGALKAATDG